MYLSQETLRSSFSNLRSLRDQGKSNLEQTSALFYFLSVQKVAKAYSIDGPVDLCKDTPEGERNLKSFEAEFSGLAEVAVGPNGGSLQVSELGKISRFKKNKTAASRIRSNFLSVPLHRAVTSASKEEYPKRPAPLLLLGLKATRIKYGIAAHPMWRANLDLFLSGRLGRTPYFDLGVFVSRHESFSKRSTALIDELGTVHRQLRLENPA